MLSLNQLLNQPLWSYETKYNFKKVSVTDSHFRNIPENIIEWNDFESQLKEFRESRDKKELNEKLIYKNLPEPFDGLYTFNNENDVEGILSNSLFKVVIHIFSKTSYKIDITSGEEFGTKNIIAEPDRVTWRSNNNTSKKILLLPIEIKKPFENDDKLFENYVADHKKSQKIVQQAVGYMYRNLLKYSIITTYNNTYALHLLEDGVLMISKPFKYNSTDSSVIAMMWYLIHLSITNARLSLKCKELKDGNKDSSKKRKNYNSNNTDFKKIYKSNITPENISDDKSIKYGGKSKRVYYGKILNKNVIVKTAFFNTPQYAKIYNEINIYKHLSSIQGIYIPKVISSGEQDNRIYLILEKIGESIETKKKYNFNFIPSFIKAIDAIHHLGILHCDLESRNILLWRKHIYIIDFEESKININKNDLRDEKNDALIHLKKMIIH